MKRVDVYFLLLATVLLICGIVMYVGLLETLGSIDWLGEQVATINSALGVSCSVQGDGVRFCGTNTEASNVRSTSPTWDNTPIDVNIAFPPKPSTGPDGKFPLMMMFHGYGGHKLYLFRADHGKTSNCYGQCASYWPPLLTTGTPKAVGSVKVSLLGTTKR